MARSSGLQVRSRSGKKQVGSCRNEALFSRTIQGQKQRIVAAELAVTSVPVGAPLHARGLAAPTECAAPPHHTNQLPFAQDETWSRELPLAKVAGRGTARKPGRWCHRKSSQPSLGISSSTRLKTRHMDNPALPAILSSRLPSRVHPDSLCPTESTASWLRSTWTQFSVDSAQAKLRPPPRGDGTRGPLSEMRIWKACFLFQG